MASSSMGAGVMTAFSKNFERSCWTTTSSGTSSMASSRAVMRVTSTYWNMMNIQILVGYDHPVNNLSSVITNMVMPALEMTDAYVVIEKIFSQIPISSAPVGSARLNRRVSLYPSVRIWQNSLMKAMNGA